MDRAKLGGHNVPPFEIERNFYGNLMQLNKHFAFIDELKVIDTSESTRLKVLALFKKGEVISSVPVLKLPEWFEKGLPNLYQKIFESEGPLRSAR